MRSQRLGSVYAKALFETVSRNGSTEKILSEVRAGLNRFIEAVDTSKELRAALFMPVTSIQEKMGIVKALGEKLDFPPVLVHFLSLMARKGRLRFVHSVREALDAVRLEAKGGMLGELVSADELEASEIEGLAAAFSERFKRDIEFKVSVDPQLIAGLKVTVNGVTYDGSLRAQLDQLREKFVYEGSETSH